MRVTYASESDPAGGDPAAETTESREADCIDRAAPADCAGDGDGDEDPDPDADAEADAVASTRGFEDEGASAALGAEGSAGVTSPPSPDEESPSSSPSLAAESRDAIPSFLLLLFSKALRSRASFRAFARSPA